MSVNNANTPFLRLARRVDLPALSAIDNLIASNSKRKQAIISSIEAQNAYVLLQGDIAIGYAVLHQHFFNRPFLDLLFIDQLRRRAGLGAFVIGEIEKIVKSHHELWTSTNESNQPMRSLLMSAGYTLKGSVEVDTGDPDLFYWKDLHV